MKILTFSHYIHSVRCEWIEEGFSNLTHLKAAYQLVTVIYYYALAIPYVISRGCGHGKSVS
jgi:hypothetical protein